MAGDDLTWKSHRHARGGFSLQRPAGWPILENTLGAAFILIAPGPEGFRSNMNVTFEQPPEGVDLDLFCTAEKERLAKVLTDLEMIDEVDVQIAAGPARHLSGSFRQGVFKVILDQWNLVDRDRIVSVSAAAEVSVHDDFLPIVERVVTSLTLEDDDTSGVSNL